MDLDNIKMKKSSSLLGGKCHNFFFYIVNFVKYINLEYLPKGGHIRAVGMRSLATRYFLRKKLIKYSYF